MRGTMRAGFFHLGEEKVKWRTGRNLIFVFNYPKEDYRENKTRLFSNLCSETQWISAKDVLVRNKKNVFT